MLYVYTLMLIISKIKKNTIYVMNYLNFSKKIITRRRWNRTTEYISPPTDLKSALHTSEDHPRILYIYMVLYSIYI